MTTFIDLNSELLVDRSQVRNPYLRLLLTAVGREVVRGSPWVAVDKLIVTAYEPLQFILGQRSHSSAA
jgi:hypothetical protein